MSTEPKHPSLEAEQKVPDNGPRKKRTRAKHPHLSPTLSPLAEAIEDWRRSLRRVAQAGALPTLKTKEEAEAWALDYAGAPPDGWRVVATRHAVVRTNEFGKALPMVREWEFDLERAK